MLERDYRAKVVQDTDFGTVGEWVYGSPLHNTRLGIWFLNIESRKGAAIIDPATLGQYTGRLDINAKRIYEGDIVLVTYNPYNAALDRTEEKKFFGQVKYDDFHACFIVEDFDGDKYRAFEYQIIEVIGNIHNDIPSEA